MKNSGLNSSDLKALNRGLALKLIITGESNTRIELSRKTGLTKMTLSNIIAELIERKYVGEKEPDYNNNVGRNPMLIDILPATPKLIGVNISRDHIKAILCDLKLNIIKKVVQPLQNETKDTLQEKLIVNINEVNDGNVIGIGVSAIGPLDAKQGVILNPTNFFGITDLDITDFLSNSFNLPVYLNNDMKSAALCEKIFGSGKNLSDFLYIGISNGIGSGIITEDKLYQHGGLSGEIGHVSIDYNGNACSCGNKGCLETYAGVPFLTKKLQKATGKLLTFKEFCSMDTEQVNEILADAVEKLSYALISQVNMLNPSAVILGHEGAWLPQKHISTLQKRINDLKLSKQHTKVSVLIAKYGADAPVCGSACSVLEQIFNGNLI